jgi:hypothetical protein
MHAAITARCGTIMTTVRMIEHPVMPPMVLGS